LTLPLLKQFGFNSVVGQIVRARDRERRLVVQEVMRRGDEAAESGDMQVSCCGIEIQGFAVAECSNT
jgi:hypothetical protein